MGVQARATAPRSAAPRLDVVTVETAREAAGRERAVTESLIVEKLELGAIVAGPNTFRARITNRTAGPMSVGLDLRAEAGLWFGNWQHQFRFEIAPGRTQVVEATYEFPNIAPEAVLRVRVGRAQPRDSGGFEVVDLALNRRYAVGEGNPAARDMTASFPELHTEHLDLYASKGSLAEAQISRIASEREEGLRKIAELLDVRPKGRIRLVFYADGVSKLRDTGHTGAGLARGNDIVEIYNAETRVDPFHELTHVLARQVGDPPALFNEGLAVYVSERLGSHALDSLGHPGATIDQAACELVQSGRVVPLRQLFSYEEIGSEATEPRVAYPHAASVVKYLIEVTGLGPFRKAYATLVNSDDPEQIRQNERIFADLFGQSLDQVERAWRQRLSCSPSGPGP
jgi:hypothetical protein